jgi:hypothetical protein
MLDSAFHSAGQVMPMRHVTHVDDPQGDNAVFEDIWSERMYEEIMQAAQTHISDWHLGVLKVDGWVAYPFLLKLSFFPNDATF